MRRQIIRLPDITAEEAWELPARAWNALIKFLARNQIIHAAWMEDGGAGHAWETGVTWDGKQWRAKVRPGFVNGRPALARFRDGAQMRDVQLIDDPSIPITSFRPVPDPPEWFSQRWRFRGSTSYQISDEGGRRVVDVEAERDAQAAGGWRSLWSTSVVLRMARPRVVVDTSSGTVLLTLAGKSGGSAVLTIGRDVPEEAPDNRGILLGERDSGEDSLLVATIYMLSPGGYPATDPPNELFAPYVEHHRFWNLNHRAFPPELPGEGLNLGLPYLGFGSEIIRRMVQDLNRQDSALAAQMTAARVASQWWSV